MSETKWPKELVEELADVVRSVRYEQTNDPIDFDHQVARAVLERLAQARVENACALVPSESWIRGTLGKQYDDEETAHVLREDFVAAIAPLLVARDAALAEALAEAKEWREAGEAASTGLGALALMLSNYGLPCDPKMLARALENRGAANEACEHELADARMQIERLQHAVAEVTQAHRNVFDERNALRARAEAAEKRAADLGAALREALNEWEYAAQYKGEFLSKKHGDAEDIARLRRLLPPEPNTSSVEVAT